MTHIPFDSQRLANTFTTLCEIDSPARNEELVAQYLINFFSALPNVEFFEDDSARVTGSSTGNLIFRLPGTNPDLSPIFFNCHMDVIAPCLGVKVICEDSIFRSAGNTVLGSDDKAGIAILLELSLILHESKISHCPLEFVFTTCEEIGLLGAKAFKPDNITAKQGFALDSTGVDNVIIGAPAAVYINATIQGRAAHAGLNPEDGISSIFLASQAISRLPLGRLDPDSTANIGLIEGGTATNIIPEIVKIYGEIRSHSSNKLAKHTSHFKDIFTNTVQLLAPDAHLIFNAPPQYPAMRLPSTSPLISLVNRASASLDREIHSIIAGGGSDANIFNSLGLETAILGIGMENVHSTSEQISLNNIIRTLELCYSLITS